MFCCLADGQGVPKTPQATRVAAIPEHEKPWLDNCSRILGQYAPRLAAFATDPVWGWSQTMLALISCDPSLCSKLMLRRIKFDQINIFYSNNFHLKVFTADSILVATHPFANLSEWLVWLTSCWFWEKVFFCILFAVRKWSLEAYKFRHQCVINLHKILNVNQ